MLWGVGVVLGSALCFGLYLGLRRGIWEVLCVLDCVLDNCIGFGELLCFGIIVLVAGRCFVFWCFGRLKC